MNRREELLHLEKKIGYQFQDFDLLVQAMTHSSYANEHHMERTLNNERLEFLGDAVLEVVSSEFLFQQFPDQPEGELTKKRASMVCETALAFCGRELEIGAFLLLGKGEDATGGRQRESIVSDAVEALIGAIYLDGGFANAKDFILEHILNDMEHKQLFYDSKTTLQEMVQGKYDQDVSYVLVKEEGPDHDKTFTAEAYLGDRKLGRGSGRTKKAAEQQAAYHAILLLKK
ncbi:MAG: ribonuclease III [Lachnospiraceae bacterium]|jgi:ribonuclease-3